MKSIKSNSIIIVWIFGVVFSTLFSFSQWAENTRPEGNLVIIGGGLNSTTSSIYNKFIDLGGGKEKIRIAIIPTAGGTPVQSGQYMLDEFARYGVPKTSIEVFPVAVMDDPSTPGTDESKWSENGFKQELADKMRGFNAVFFTGGDQLRYVKTLKTPDGKDGPLLTAIREIYMKGGVLGGTSAGAAMQTDPMICDGAPIDAVLKGAHYQVDTCSSEPGVSITRGLGFMDAGLVDQHFFKRGRLGRLITALNHLQTTLGIGIDEDTAAVFHGKTKTIEVVGNSGVLIVDTSKASIKMTENGLKAGNVVVHYLEQGDFYDIGTGKFTISPNRKLIEKGKEYYTSPGFTTDIFGKDAIKDAIITGLGDNSSTEAGGISFALGNEKNGIVNGNGVRITLRKNANTLSYNGTINDNDTYSVLNISVEIVPIRINIDIIK